MPSITDLLARIDALEAKLAPKPVKDDVEEYIDARQIKATVAIFVLAVAYIACYAATTMSLLGKIFVFFNDVIVAPLFAAAITSMAGDRPYQQALVRGVMWTQEYSFNATHMKDITAAYCTTTLVPGCGLGGYLVLSVVDAMSYGISFFLQLFYLLLLPVDVLANYASIGLSMADSDDWHAACMIALAFFTVVQLRSKEK